MITEDQSEVVAWLDAPGTHGSAAVERIETHASIVFLAGPRALKLKRAVKYDYLDFSTVERRKAMCEAEVRLNRRTAPDLYRGTMPVTREPDGSLALDGRGTPVEWVVEMVRFDESGLLDRLAARRALDLALMPPLGSAVARFHAGAARRDDHGGTRGMRWVVEGNWQGLVHEGAGFLDPPACAALTAEARSAVARHSALLDARRAGGLVRQCHGDLHLRNIVLLDGRPTLFDGVEFNDEIACIDVLYDLAFLLMDLWRRELPSHANSVFNAYLGDTCDLAGLPALPLFLSCRAAVRAKTNATAANLQTGTTPRRDLQEAAQGYLTLAQRLLQPPPPCLIAVGGFSGSGKSTLARLLAPSLGATPGAVVIRSDEIRKRLCGVQPLDRLPPDGYTAGVSHRVYTTVARRAGVTVTAGHAAIADAVFARASDRESLEREAAAAGVPFIGLWLDAPEAELIARSQQRRRDPSDADADVIERQLAAGTGPMSWHRIDASSGPEQVLARAVALMRNYLTKEMLRDASRAA